MKTSTSQVIGLEMGPVGRAARLILGFIPLAAVAVQLLNSSAPLPKTLVLMRDIGIFVALTAIIYIALYVVLSERVLGLLEEMNPWVAALITQGPPLVISLLAFGPVALRTAIGVYVSASSILNFVISYGGCEVLAIPTLIFGKRYTVYCPYNVLDVVEKAVVESREQAS